MKIAIWNVNSIKARLEHVKTWLTANNPDVLMVQELKGLEFPANDFKAIGYETSAVPQKAYNGVAIFARQPIKVVTQRLPGDEADEQARYLEADIGPYRFINIYAPNGNPVDSDKFPYKLGWLNRLYQRLETLRQDNVPVIIGGDFNIIPENEDCYDPVAWASDALFRTESRRLYRSFLNLGYTDAFRTLTKGGQHYTFWDYQAGAWQRNNGIRIDHFLLSPPVADKLTSCTIDKAPRGLDQPSDHTPVVLELKA